MRMREVEFNQWLKAGGANTEAGRSTRVHAVRTIENNLTGLGSPHPDLDAAWAADRFEHLRERLKRLRDDFLAGGTEYRILMPQSTKPDNRLSSWRSWLGQYGQFLSGAPRGDRDADLIRQHVLESYIEPAREREADTVDVLVRDVNGALQLNQAWPNICQALGGPKFLEMADVPPPERIGADQSSATIFRFDLNGGATAPIPGADRPFVLYDASGAAFKPVRNFNRATGISAYRIKPPGASNRADEAIEVETIAEVARAMLIEQRPARVQSVNGGTVNYLAYGKQRLIRYELDPAIAAQIGVPPTGSIESTDAPMTDEEILARFTKKPGFKSWLASWSDDQCTEFLRLVRQTHDAGLDWYHVNIDRQVRFGRKKPGAIDATEVFGSISKLVPVGWIRRPEDRAALGLNDEWQSLESCAAAIEASPDVLARFRGQKGRWPDEVAPDQDDETDNPAKAPVVTDQPLPTNLILYGPPGTGKTYATARKAVELCGEVAPDDRDALMIRYRALQQDGRIAFVTFHQNYSYEDFVEGLRPETGGDESGSTGFRLEPRPGIFREICALAEQARTRTTTAPGASTIDLSGRRFWKMGQGAIGSEDEVYDDAIAGKYIALGWGGAVDWSDGRFSSFEAIKREWLSAPRDSDSPSNWTQLWPFRCEMKPGDIVIVPYGNSAFRAIAEVTGDYYYVAEADGYYAQRRPVRWLLTLDDPLPLDTIVDGKFTMRTLYSLPSKRVNVPALARLLPGNDDAKDRTEQLGSPDQFVLIIDEINRANVSKVFGELITLLEPDKRLGMPGCLTVTLPYSKRRDFGVPANLHIIGTMNTADRSIALLDTALRRRFEFDELMPRYDIAELIEAGRKGKVDLAGLLRTLNERIEYLFDREHQIGHAYFIGCTSRRDIDSVMRHKVIPLLAEYFYEDWGKVARVLGDAGDGANGFLQREKLTAPPGADGDHEDTPRYRWRVRDEFNYGAFTAS